MYLTLSILHALAGAVWLGAMVYSLFLLQPKAKAYFGNDADFERFITAASSGARWKVLGGLVVIGLSGIVLAMLIMPASVGAGWWSILGAKALLFVVAVGLFVHVSWRLWPARLFADATEVQRYQRSFRRAGMSMAAIATASIALGIAARFYR